MKTLLRFLQIFALSVLFSLPVSGATTYSLVWDVPPAADKVTLVNIYKKTGTTYSLLATVLGTVVKWLIPNAQSGEVYAAEPVNVAGRGPMAEATVQGLPGKLNVRVLIEITP